MVRGPPTARRVRVPPGRGARVSLSFALAACAALVASRARAQPADGPPVVDEAEASPAPAQEAPAPAEPPAPIDVTVEGERAPPGSTSLGRRDIREMPGVLGDPYRVVEVQPGVTPTASGFPYYFIRGAPPGNVGYFFDGIQVPLLFHVGGGPSVIPPFVVRRVDLHPGPRPVERGRFAGAVIEADSTPASTDWRGEGGLRLGDVGAVVEGPVGDNLTVLTGGRYSAGAAIVSAFVPNIDVQYADYQLRLTYKTGPDAHVQILAFGAVDYLATISDDDGEEDRDVLLDSDFHRLDVRYQTTSTEGTVARASATLGLDRSRDVGVESARDWKAALRASVAHPALEGHALLRAGVDVSVDGYDVKPRPPLCEPEALVTTDCTPRTSDPGLDELDDAFRALFPSRVDLAAGVWADAVIALGGRSSVTPGLRLDHYTSRGATALAVDPMILGKFGLGEHVHLVPAVGIASQLPGFAPIPALQIGGIPGGLQRSVQTSFGAEFHVAPVELVTTVFRQATLNLTDPVGTGRGTALGADRFLTRSLGDAYGLEVGARGALRRDLLFLVSYTLSRATRRLGSKVFPSAYDRTHVAHVALLYDLGDNWRAGVRHVLYTGFPADEAGIDHVPQEHPDRVAPFYRLDVRLAKRWKTGERSFVALVLDLQNATLSKEVFDVSCEGDRCTPRTIGPITIPGLALEAGF